MSDVRAIFVSDLHLQSMAPPARAGEPDWFEAMKKPLLEIAKLRKVTNNAPIFYAGDIFDYWKSSPKLINFALQHLPPGYAIPGQHDLPNHSFDMIEDSAYWTLVLEGLLSPLLTHGASQIPDAGNMIVTGFPWGKELTPCCRAPGEFHVALIHRFVWTDGCGYENAPKGQRVAGYADCLKGYDLAVFGDNHKGFIQKIGDGPIIANCGAMMRRRSDEGDYVPGVILLYNDGSVRRHYLSTVGECFDAFTQGESAINELLGDMTEFVGRLGEISEKEEFDFVELLKRFFNENDTPEAVSKIIIEASERKTK